MSKCDLDFSNPRFAIAVADDKSLEEGLKELRNKVKKDHRLSGWFNQPMKKYPEFQNRVWKWDFAPEGATGSTRKSWRLYAYVPDPKASEPIPATAFLLYPKSEDRGGDYVTRVAEALKSFLRRTFELKTAPERFRRQMDGQGMTVSLCYECFAKVAHSSDVGEVEIAEDTHECSV